MKRMIFLAGAALLGAVGFFCLPRAARADCGSIPFYAPSISDLNVVVHTNSSKQVEFDPLHVTVFEPHQRAIILWNGREEILLLSTDQRATQKSAILEVIPMPGKPSVRLGSFKSFEVAQRMVIEKNMWAFAHPGMRGEVLQAAEPAGRIEFSEKLGAHDLTVAEVLDRDRFVGFVQGHLRAKYQTPAAPIRSEFIQIIQGYLDQGIRWFAFDMIVLDGSVKSREPIEYRFASEQVFYPLRISRLEQGKTQADLLVFSAGNVGRFTGLDKKFIKSTAPASVSQSELGAMNPDWSDFFGLKAGAKMVRWQIEGESPSFSKDVQAQ